MCAVYVCICALYVYMCVYVCVRALHICAFVGKSDGDTSYGETKWGKGLGASGWAWVIVFNWVVREGPTDREGGEGTRALLQETGIAEAEVPKLWRAQGAAQGPARHG